MKYWQSTVLHRWLVFQGVAYDVGLSVDSSITWNVWCFGYEFDVIARDRRFLGVILEANYTNIRAELESAVAYEYARARAPIPAIGRSVVCTSAGSRRSRRSSPRSGCRTT